MTTAYPVTRFASLAVVALVAATTACTPTVRVNSVSPPVNDAATAIPAIMTEMADAWNRGDLAGHVRPYADSATFMTPSGPQRGRERIRLSLGRSFWKDGKPKQRLSFDQLEVRPLGEGYALLTGHFVLSGGGEAEQSGRFSLTWEKSAAGWRILHDHSS